MEYSNAEFKKTIDEESYCLGQDPLIKKRKISVGILRKTLPTESSNEDLRTLTIQGESKFKAEK